MKELVIEPLSDDEIDRLLRFLEENGELNTLQPLDPQMRFNVVKRLYNKDLLVVLRQTTEGKSFDAILEDEYSGIRDELSRRLYLTVCCFYQKRFSATAFSRKFSTPLLKKSTLRLATQLLELWCMTVSTKIAVRMSPGPGTE